MTHSFLERIGQPEVDLTNHREESIPFNVHDATSILEFCSSQMFLMLFRDSLGTMETERNALVIEDFSYKFLNENGFLKPEKGSILWLFVEFQFDIYTGFLYTWLRQEMMYSLWDYVCDCLDMFLAFRQILDRCLPIWDDLLWQNRFLDDLQKFFGVWEYTCIVYVPTPPPFFLRKKTVEPILWRVVYVSSSVVWNDQ